MLVVALLAFLFGFPHEGVPVKIRENGVCAGLSWITAQTGEDVTMDVGPDFRVYRFTGPNEQWWGLYSGNASQVSGSTGTMLVKRDDVTVRQAIVDGKFRGYLATNRKGHQNHFFGSVFKNNRDDIRFFSRVDFGPAGRAKCERNPSQ